MTTRDDHYEPPPRVTPEQVGKAIEALTAVFGQPPGVKYGGSTDAAVRKMYHIGLESFTWPVLVWCVNECVRTCDRFPLPADLHRVSAGYVAPIPPLPDEPQMTEAQQAEVREWVREFTARAAAKKGA